MKLLITCFFLVLTISASAQQKGTGMHNAAISKPSEVKAIYLLRIKGNDLLKDKKFDSAGRCFAKIIKDSIQSNGTDYIFLACCGLQLMDTTGFRKYLIHSIEIGGADSLMITRLTRSLDSGRQVYLKIFLANEYSTHRAIFLKKIDPAVEKEMIEITVLDQFFRKHYNEFPRDTGSVNYKVLTKVGKYMDSVNYGRVANLIKQNKYPGYHNYGLNADPFILMHVSDEGEDRWNYIFNFVKQQVLSGDMMPNTAVAIATRHFRYQNCTYYGTKKDDLTQPCDCEQVDKFRAEIGLDSLKEEYARQNLKLPDCYHE